MISLLRHVLDSTAYPFDVGVLKKRLVHLEIIGTTYGSGGHIQAYWEGEGLTLMVTREPVERLLLFCLKVRHCGVRWPGTVT